MCTVCGCGGATVEGQAEGQSHGSHHHAHGHGPHHHHDHAHDHHAHHHHGEHGDLHYGEGAAGVSVPGMSQSRLIEIETDILSKNDAIASGNRRVLRALGAFAVNLVSSPGSGKTTLLCRTIEMLGDRPLAVIEGDQQTSNDADRIRATGARAIQVNTGKGCHLDAHMVGHAMDHLELERGALLFIENVGNLVCPAGFDLGENAKVAILSVTEGEDKPLKYPDMFTVARLAILNKTDLAPHCDVDLDLYEANLRRVNPDIEILRVSARTGEGMPVWLDWLDAHSAGKAAGAAV
ncbi:hydrogenase nickel incorporation protein HypB [Rhodovulum sulfidophilum]|uniref:hydrogenase nickel incorporation protein HypB n=1 Tax=Rhodovulum sulfidophilum TaxID=35806 RepID=UPI001921D9B6|nr:hydrogenase nickel incorporation protein HypB [Rhodovulum sulfidophilum]MBL3575010.1 hydrogenase nickel incorporation protein HypB [Rhodovulum sulfidophilum]MCE8430589.1 hydrogenase nickel incorporation protein HypB [Rhodovulum sulfidophilum]MCF4117795.1 hydrogenase nickel incorporation protein HypB [Rhodovulum sulfidophilum]